jgi:hypothetical protein
MRVPRPVMHIAMLAVAVLGVIAGLRLYTLFTGS